MREAMARRVGNLWWRLYAHPDLEVPPSDCSFLRRHLVVSRTDVGERWLALQSTRGGGTLPPEDLETPVGYLLDSLREGVRADRFAAIVGEDTSGRLPASAIEVAINGWRARQGLQPIPRIAIQGLKRADDPRLPVLRRRLLWRLRELAGVPEGAAVLVVTDWINTGDSARLLVRELQALGHPCEVATLGAEAPFHPGSLGVPFHSGSAPGAPSYYSRPEYTGLNRSKYAKNPRFHVWRSGSTRAAAFRDARAAGARGAGRLALGD